MSDALAQFDEKLAAAGMRGQWKSEEFLARAIGGPKPAGQLAKWTWKDVTGYLDEAGVVMPQSLQSRRSLIFQNPGLPRGTTQTINMGVQSIQPGETAWAHRHSISALRFIIKGSSRLTTIVDGEECVMEDNDLVLTPNWAWHDHHNHSSKPTFWLDVLDVPLVLSLNQTFYEPGVSEAQPSLDDVRRRDTVLRYPWKEIEPQLRASPVTPLDGQVFEYRNLKGGPTLPTLQCKMQILPPGFQTQPRKRTSSAVFFVVGGEGAIGTDDHRMDWGKNDSFVLPNWVSHRLINRSSDKEAILFSVHDTPVMQALELYREDHGRTIPDGVPPGGA